MLGDLVCFLLGNTPVSEVYMPTFRNTLFHLHRQVLPKRKHTTYRTRRKLGDLVLRLLVKACNLGERQIGWATLGRYHNSCHFTDVTNKYQLEDRLTNTCSKLSLFFFWPMTYKHADPNSLVYYMAGMLTVLKSFGVHRLAGAHCYKWTLLSGCQEVRKNVIRLNYLATECSGCWFTFIAILRGKINSAVICVSFL